MLIEWKEWLWIFSETPKYFLITYGILGFELKKGKKKYFSLLYLLLLPIWHYIKANIVVYKALWYLLVMVCFFQGHIKKKAQMFVLEYCIIASIDNFFWCIFATLTSVAQMRPGTIGNYLGDFFNMLVWLFPLFLLKKQRRQIRECIEQLSWKWILLLIGTFIICGLIMGAEELRILEEMPKTDEKLVALIEAGAVIAIIIVGIVLLYTVYSREQFKREREIQAYIVEEQKTYYHRKMQQEEQIRAFRHDIDKHLRVVHALQKEGRLEESQRYLENLSGKLVSQKMVSAGNAIADYLINATIRELEEDGKFEYNIQGCFPPSIAIADEEMTVLLGNALDNAKEALFQVKENRKLLIRIENNLPDLYITIGNTSNNQLKEKDGYFETTKKDQKNHGYGMRNMRQVVEHYEGEITWEQRPGWFQMEIHIKVK